MSFYMYLPCHVARSSFELIGKCSPVYVHKIKINYDLDSQLSQNYFLTYTNNKNNKKKEMSSVLLHTGHAGFFPVKEWVIHESLDFDVNLHFKIHLSNQFSLQNACVRLWDTFKLNSEETL